MFMCKSFTCKYFLEKRIMMLKKQTYIKPKYIVEMVNDDIVKCQYYDDHTRHTYFERFGAPRNIQKGDLLGDGEYGELIYVKKSTKKKFL